MYFTLSLPGAASWVPTSSIKLITSCVKLISLAVPRRSSRLRICCKTPIISVFRSSFDQVTASIHYYPTSKWLTLSSAALELASICLSAVINYKQSFVNRCLIRDCYWHVLPCFTLCVSHFYSYIIILFDSIWFDIIFSTIIGWRLSVLINDMLCYVMHYYRATACYELTRQHHSTINGTE